MTMAYNLPKGMMASHTVLVTALDSLEDSSVREDALRLIRESYALGPTNHTVENTVIRCAQAKILNEPFHISKFKLTKNPVDRRTFETLATAWMVWATGGNPEPFVASVPKPTEYGGALHLMALEPWGRAIVALGEENLEEAVRWFRRSIEFGAQYGIETLDTVQWTYVASVFHRGT
jgi:hypothetical protein